MTLELRGVENAGDLERERVVMRAASDVDIGSYALFRCVLAPDGKPYSGPIHYAYWFSDVKVKAGDFVVLYSKVGQTSEKRNESGPASYFFYWQSKTPIWLPGTAPALVDTPDWTIGNAIPKVTSPPA